MSQRHSCYEKLLEFIQSGRKKTERQWNYCTRLFLRSDQTIEVKLHRTVILKLFPDGRIQFDNGRWWTTLTRRYMNRFLFSSMRVYREHRKQRTDWVFWLRNYYEGRVPDLDLEVRKQLGELPYEIWPYKNGMIFDPSQNRMSYGTNP